MEPAKLKQSPKAIGECSEAMVLAKLVEVGYNVLKPFGDSKRYDLLVEYADGKYWRVQCKTGWLEGDGSYIKFLTCSSYAHTRAGRTGQRKKNYRGQIDYFGVYSPDLRKVYLVPVEYVGIDSAVLRLLPPKSNQKNKILWAINYEVLEPGLAVIAERGPGQETHKTKGERSEAIIQARFLELGYRVLTPSGDNLRYDLMIEDSDRRCWRVQCKTGWLENNGAYIEFATSSNYYRTKAGKTEYSRKDYRGEVDYFAVYSPETKRIYLVPIDHVSVSSGALRLLPTKNNQEKGVRWAKDYEL